MRIAALAIVLAAAMGGVAATAAQGSAPRPNILMVVTDDMGWGQPGFNGGTEVGTPNLDRIANEGVRFTQFYASPGCSPTRASLLTGRHYWKTGGVQERATRDSTVGMLLDERTMADVLRAAGYETWAIGKWHLGKWHLGHLPLQRGFDHHYGMYTGTIGYNLHRHTGILDWHRNGRPVVEKGYATFLMAEEAVQLIGRHDGGNPFFLYLAFNAPHLPKDAPDEYVERYAHTAAPDQRAQLKALDDALGWVLDALEAKGILDDTLVVYLNDNGGTERAGGNAPYRGLKGDFHEGGIRVPAAMRWPGRIPKRSESDALLHVVDVFPTLAGLAGASTTDGLPLDGLDAWRAIAEGAESPRRELAHSRKVMRVGDWKLLERNGVSYGGRYNSRLQLYNIAEDPYEESNLAGSEPAKVEELRARLAEHREAARDPAPRSRVPEGVFVFGLDENAAYGAAVEWAVTAIKAGNTGPVLERLEAVDDTLRLVYDEAVDTGSVPPASAFRVVTTPSYAAVEVAAVEASGADVVLTLASRLGPGTTVGMTYDVPDIDAIRDGDGLEAVGITWRTDTASSVEPVWQSTATVSVEPVWQSTATVEARDQYRGYSSIANPDLGTVADHTFDYGEGAAYQVQVVMAYSDGVMFQVRNRGDAISGLVLEWAGETLPLADAVWDANWDRYTWGQAWLDANAPSLNASAYTTTLPDGGTTEVCLRFAEQTCQRASTETGSGTASDDATLASLALSGIDIGTFAAGTASYTATVSHDVSSTQVTVTANGAGASITIADADGSTAGTSRTVALAEGSNTITVTVTAEDGATTRTYTATVTRVASVPEPPALSVADAEVAEGEGAVLSFAVTLSHGAPGAVTVEYATRDGTATQGDDYRVATGTLAFAARETAKTVSVAVLDDDEDEDDETLTLTLSNAAGASVADGSATGTVWDNDPSADATLASLALSGIDIGTFAAGTASYTATVSHDVSSTQVTVTANGAGASITIADADGSTAGTSRTVALAEGSNTITVTVTAEDGSTTASYRVTVTREAPPATTPLTASFGSAPASHNGSTGFTVDLAFSEDIATSFRVLRDQALSASGGTITKVNRVDGRGDLWQVHIEPSGNGDVTLTLAPATDDCAVAGSVCTADGHALSNTPSVFVDGPVPLTASFSEAPASHDGSTGFTVHLGFSEDIATGFRMLRDQALSASGGTVTKVNRVDGRGDLWQVHVEPTGNGSVTLMLDPATDDCAQTGSVCTADGRALSNTPSVFVEGPELRAWFSEAPAEHDGTNEFTVRLSFTDDITTSFRVLRNEALSATGGTVRNLRRVNGQNHRWRVHVEPSGNDDVTLTLDPTTDDCGETGSVCTSDGRALSNMPSVTVSGPSSAGATANGPLVTLKWRNLRDDFGSPAASDYGVRVNGRARAVVSAELDGATAWLRLASPVSPGDAVTVAYLGSAMHPLADATGQVRSKPWDGLVAENLTGVEPIAAGPATIEWRAADPLTGAADDVVRLDASGLGLSEVWGIERLSALERLDLSGNEISDLSPLASLENLRNLDLSENQVADLWPLAGLYNLERLSLSGNTLSDLSLLAGLENLRDLDLSENQVADLWPLAGLYNLERLNLSVTGLTDLQALAGLPNLTVLLLNGNNIAHGWPVASLAKLENLGLSGNRVGDVIVLQNLKHLRRLDLTGNPLADLSPLGDIGSLVWLALPEDRASSSAETLGRLTELSWVWFGKVEAARK